MTTKALVTGSRSLSGIALAFLLCATCFDARAEDERDGGASWLTISGEARMRYETLDGQFRTGGSGGDQGIFLRSLVKAEAEIGRASVGAELQDARAYLDDAGSPISTSVVNPVDLLQAYVRIDMPGLVGQKRASLTLGRQTLDIGSRRVLERVEFANVIFAYTGVYWSSASDRGDELHALFVVPVGRFPTDRAALGNNQQVSDKEEWGRRLWGIHYRRPNVAPWLPRTWAEIFVYGLDESDTDRVPTPNRHYVQPGFRLFRAPSNAQWDLDIEGSYRTGSRRATTNVSDMRDLEVNAWTLHAHIGYTLDLPWKPRLSVDYDYASGDKDPNDGHFDQYERLFGGRRTDLGHTGIFGPFTPANLDAPGARIEVTPTSRFDARLAYKAAQLASARDAWVVARVQDRSGASGRFLGHAVDARMRYWLVSNSLRAEVGASVLFLGRFAREAPNASRQGTALYGYSQLALTF